MPQTVKVLLKPGPDADDIGQKIMRDALCDCELGSAIRSCSANIGEVVFVAEDSPKAELLANFIRQCAGQDIMGVEIPEGVA